MMVEGLVKIVEYADWNVTAVTSVNVSMDILENTVK